MVHPENNNFMYCKFFPKFCNILVLTSVFKFPIGRLNCLNPLGHSGHFRLQAVVGSMEIAIGVPQCIGFFNNLEI